MDRLTALLRHFELRSQLYFSGRKCGVMDFGDDDGLGHVHVLRAGTLTLVGPDGNAVVLDVPTVLFCPYPTTHRLQIDPPLEAELVCASLSFGHADGNAVLRSLPSPLLVPLTALPQQGRLLDLLFDEAFGAYCGHRAAVDRLMEVLVIQLLRHAMRNGLADSAGWRLLQLTVRIVADASLLRPQPLSRRLPHVLGEHSRQRACAAVTNGLGHLHQRCALAQ